jgi:hypothetical protein
MGKVYGSCFNFASSQKQYRFQIKNQIIDFRLTVYVLLINSHLNFYKKISFTSIYFINYYWFG